MFTRISLLICAATLGTTSLLYAQEKILDGQLRGGKDRKALEEFTHPVAARLGEVQRVNADTSISHCTGLLIGNGLVLTANHCVGPNTTFRWGQRLESGKEVQNGVSQARAMCSGNFRDGEFLYLHKDWAILWLKDSFQERLENIDTIELADESPSSDDSLALFGYSLSKDDMKHPFSVDDENGNCRKSNQIPANWNPPTPGKDYFMHSCESGFGASGAPIVNESAEVVGINVAAQRVPFLNIAIGVSNFRTILEGMLNAEDDGELAEFIRANSRICQTLK